MVFFCSAIWHFIDSQKDFCFWANIVIISSCWLSIDWMNWSREADSCDASARPRPAVAPTCRRLPDKLLCPSTTPGSGDNVSRFTYLWPNLVRDQRWIMSHDDVIVQITKVNISVLWYHKCIAKSGTAMHRAIPTQSKGYPETSWCATYPLVHKYTKYTICSLRNCPSPTQCKRLLPKNDTFQSIMKISQSVNEHRKQFQYSSRN